MRKWTHIGIVGAGTMGGGIAQVAAEAGCQVTLVDASEDALASHETNFKATMDKLVLKGKRSQSQANTTMSNITRDIAVDGLSEADVVIEAIVESMDAKQKLFQALEDVVSDQCVLATNTSSLSVTGVASACQRPERVIGLHFFNPAPLMGLVEVIPALQTHPDLGSHAMSVLTSWGKFPALVQDTPGFIVNRVARPFYSEAIRILEEGLADVADIDASVKSLGFRMGPFELMDLIGHDINYAVTSTVHSAFFGDARYRPSHTQRQLVAANWLGRKRGRGFYTYNAEGKHNTSGQAVEGVGQRILTMLMNEAADAVFWQVASPKAIDTAMQKGVNYPKGLLAWLDERGVHDVVAEMDALHQRYGEERYRCSPILRDMARSNGRFF
jgi:3-hydroxybutyryl-CoA dehydrogenase